MASENKTKFDQLVADIHAGLDAAAVAEQAEDAAAAETKATLEARIAELEAQIAAGGMTAEEEAEAFTALEALKARVASGETGGGAEEPAPTPDPGGEAGDGETPTPDPVE